MLTMLLVVVSGVHGQPKVIESQSTEKQATIRSLLFRDELLTQDDPEDVDVDVASNMKPATFVVNSNGEAVIIEPGTNRVFWYSADGQKLNGLTVKEAVGLSDILMIDDDIFVLDTGGSELSLFRLVGSGETAERVFVYQGLPFSGLSSFLLKSQLDDQPYSNEAVAPSNTYPYRTNCPAYGGLLKVDPWRFYKCECTSYSAWKLNERGIPFNNTFRLPSGKRWSNASNWKTAAGQAGISVDMNPKKGDIVWFTYNHVGYVESVTKTGTTVKDIVITEYNYSAYSFGVRVITKSQFSTKKIGGFIHF
jgi:surface antigen